MPDDTHAEAGAATTRDDVPPHRMDAVDRQLETLLSAIYAASERAVAVDKSRSEPSTVAEEPTPRGAVKSALPDAAPMRPPVRAFGVVPLLAFALLAVAVLVPFLPRISVGPNDVQIAWPARERTEAAPSTEPPGPPPPLLQTLATPPAAASASDGTSDPVAPPSLRGEQRAENVPAMLPPQAIASAAPVERASPPETASAPPPSIAPAPSPVTAPPQAMVSAPSPENEPAPLIAAAAPAETVPARDSDPVPPAPEAAKPDASPAAAAASVPADPPATPERSKTARIAAAPAQFLVQFGAFRNEAIGQQDCADFAKLAATRLVRSSTGGNPWFLCRTDEPRSRDDAKALIAAAVASGKSGILVEFHPAR